MNSAAPSALEEFLSKEVEDWNDEIVSRARFKALSGQRSDWEPRFQFWRDLIVKVARHLRVFTIRPSEVKNVWFVRGGLTPLCMDQVLLEMHNRGDILLRGDLHNPTSGRLYQMIRKVQHVIGKFQTFSLQENLEDTLIIKSVLQDRATDVIKDVAESIWTSTCVVTMRKFQTICKGSDEASIILSYLSECGKAIYISIKKEDFIEGVKLSLVSASVSDLSRLDYDALHLIWTSEKLQQQLDVIDQRWDISRKLALVSFKKGNKQAAYRHIRQSRLFSESRGKCTSLLERVEEVLRAIADAESTKKVSEVIQMSAQAIKKNGISAEEIYAHLQELDESIAEQKQVNEALEAMPLQSADTEDEDVEEEYMKLELELEHEEISRPRTPEPASQLEAKRTQESGESLSGALSNLNLGKAEAA